MWGVCRGPPPGGPPRPPQAGAGARLEQGSNFPRGLFPNQAF